MVMTHPSLSPQLGIWGNLLGLRGRVVRICVREVSLTLVSFTHLILVWLRLWGWVRGRWHVCYGSGLSIIIITSRMLSIMGEREQAYGGLVE